MRHRLYYLLPDISSARKVLDDLLINRIEQRHIHFLTGGAELPDDMPEANILHKTDIVHGTELGMTVGGLLGMALGILLILFPLQGYTSAAGGAAIVLASTLGGVLFGGWASGMVAATLPNSRLQAFYPEIERGKVLMIVDVPARCIEKIENLLAERHPETQFGGEEPRIPVFP